MKDDCLGWRNLRWAYDADYVERDQAPMLAQLIEKYGSMFDDVFIYGFQGKQKQFIFRMPHYNSPRSLNYRIPMEHHIPKDPHQQKLELGDKVGV